MLYIENSTVEFNNMTITEGSFDGAGAGLFCTQSTLILNAIAFNENIGTFGSALFADGCDVSGTQVQFVGNNDTNETGGSIVHAAANSSVTLDDALWRDNTGDTSFVLANSNGFLNGLVMSDNTSGGIRLSGEAIISVSRADFSGNNGTDILFSNNEGFNQGSDSSITCTSPDNSCAAR